MEWPRISVIITAYNYAHTLRTAIESARAQVYPNLEILILDNASIDATPQLVASYGYDSRIRSIRHATNIGMMANHNYGLNVATGEYIVFLSADDMLMPGHLHKQLQYLRANPDVDICFTPLFIMSEQGHILKRRSGELPTAFSSPNNFFAGLLAFGCDMCMPTMLIKKSLYDRFGYFDLDFIAADYELYVRFAAGGVRFAYMPEALAAYRAHPNQQTSVDGYTRSGQIARDFLNILKKHLTAENIPKIRGYEASVGRLLKGKFQEAIDVGFSPHDHLKSEIEIVQTQLLAMRQMHDTQDFVPKFGVVVRANTSLTELELSLRSLVDQTFEDWEALVILPDNAPLDALFTHIDPRGRIRSVMLFTNTDPGNALNTALCITPANCFAFLNAGTIFEPTHLAKLALEFAETDALAVVCPPELEITDANGIIYRAENIYAPFELIDNSLIAPTLPLDAIAFKRTAVDECMYFNEEISVLHEWDLLIRLRNLGRVHAVASTIRLRSNCNPPLEIRNAGALLEAIDSVYDYFRTEHPVVDRLRARYRTLLAAYCVDAAERMPSIDGRLHEESLLRGRPAIDALAAEESEQFAHA